MPQTTDRRSLTLSRTFKAAPERVWRAWTDTEEAMQWFGPHGMRCEVTEHDVRVGGRYRFSFPAPPPEPGAEPEREVSADGKSYTVFGEYTEVDPPRRLAFTWAWDSPGWAGKRSNVTVELEPENGGTKLTMTHTDLLDEEAARSHGEGWGASMDRLAAHVDAG
jgi:uncharacterized protein YndB with AHSA1/START domain